MQPRTLQIDGHPPTITGLHSALVAAATAHIEDVHRAPCTDQTPLLFARMDCHGVGEDLNQAVRMLSVAISERRQLILLPPGPEERYSAKGCALPTSIRLNWSQPWHWLAGQGIPLRAIIETSSCQQSLEARNRRVMEAIAQSRTGNATLTARSLGALAIAAAGREANSLWRSNIAVSRHVPRIFQRQGLLWWFQVLTTYLIRIRAPLSEMIASHPAMRPFVDRGTVTPTAAALSTDLHWHGWAVKCGYKGCGRNEAGWAPSSRFDVGAHLRLGDSCRQKGVAKKYFLKVRRCDLNLSVVLGKLRRAGVRNGTLFIASDSQQVIDEAAQGGAHPFVVSFLQINRSRFETAAPTEGIDRTSLRLHSLLEALMDITLLARSSLIAGKMMSNFPRLAVQLRVPVPREHRVGAYLSLDDRPWCSRTSCREAFLPPSEHQAATLRELQRNPAIGMTAAAAQASAVG
jgi:hypothetical protein